MTDPERIDYARREVEDIRRALLDAAAFGKTLSPTSLERMADRLTAAMHIYEDTVEHPSAP
ncbi:Uncharacterised protein [Nocardia farcinica]|uniref:DUF6374 family protein n=1 Tax=Nocardia farcinica TaxID=37329 RepID=UPI000DFA5AE4|nr:DUF6374 family protein [Nocardia farcinica]SUE28941.1 Uncharacterised protein [Nocardia farcinica]